jgi:hypothetical protein
MAQQRNIDNGMNNIDAPALNAFAITPSDTVDLQNVARMLYVGTTGNIKLTTLLGDTVTLLNVPVGILRCTAGRVFATGTTATNLVALY